jgi:cob(I)alamin adenosyltransferase
MAYTDEEIKEQLKKTRDNLIDQKYLLSKSPKPTYDIDGQKVSWAEYIKMLDEQIKSLNEQIDALEEPWEIETIGYT